MLGYLALFAFILSLSTIFVPSGFMAIAPGIPTARIIDQTLQRYRAGRLIHYILSFSKNAVIKTSRIEVTMLRLRLRAISTDRGEK
jgi:hypothetical protein